MRHDELRIYQHPKTGEVTVLPPRRLVRHNRFAPGLTAAISNDGLLVEALPGTHLGKRITAEQCPPFLRILAEIEFA